MKNIFLALCFLAIGLSGIAQTNDSIYTRVEVMPEFPGGLEAMSKFIGENLKYPDKSREAGIEGTVYIRFIVDAQGRVIQTEIVRGVNEELDSETRRVVKMMPQWTPGRQDGKAVPVYFMLPVKFSLKSELPLEEEPEQK